MFTIIIGITGSVAAIKTTELILQLYLNYNIILIFTKSGEYFFHKSKEYNPVLYEEYRKIEHVIKIYRDEDDFKCWHHIGDTVLHINLRNQADLFIIAPTSANTLAKIASGLCDNLLTNLARCWDYQKPLLIVPAMNTYMWNHPITLQHLQSIISYGTEIVPPISKLLACGDFGVGGMAEIKDIIKSIENKVQSNSRQD